jgi:RNA polymerase sigma-70 factor (ECF subfamily)
VAYRSAVLIPRVIGWSQRRLRSHRLACRAGAAPLKRRLANGARVEEAAIRLHVERGRAGEGEALGAVFDEFRPDVLRLCTRMLGAVDAEDAANETFQRAQRRLDRYDSAQPFGRWILSIAAHQCIDRLRRRSLEKRLFDPHERDVEEFSGQEGSALDQVVQSRRQTAVRAALDRLPDRHRAPLLLRYFAELDYDAIGVELDLTRSQVASLLFRAKQQLRELLRSEQEAGR